jgi:hypothetical protein
MKKLTLALFLFASAAQAQELAKTEKGRTVILYPNKTWEYYETQKKQSEPKEQSLPKKPGANCKGLTKKGLGCQSTFIDSTGYCRWHQGQLTSYIPTF